MTGFTATVNLTVTLSVGSAATEAAADIVRSIVAGNAVDTRQVDISGVVVRPLSEAELTKRRNLRLWQEGEAIKRGTADEKARFSRGELAEKELCAIASAALFLPLDDLRPMQPTHSGLIGHPRDTESRVWQCIVEDHWGFGLPLPIVWSVLPNPVLSTSEWHTLTRVNRAVNEIDRHPWLVDSTEGARVVTRLHRGVCQRCLRESAQATVQVSVTWAGRVLHREYVL